MADEFLSQAQPFEIEVIDGTYPTKKVSLVGRSLPYRPIEYSGKQRVKTTFYPGNPVATQQVVGPTEEPTTVNGMWKDRFLGHGAARALALTFDTLRRKGSVVRVTWGMGYVSNIDEQGNVTEGNPLVREGIITRTKFTFDRPQDVAWEVEFTWRGQAEQIAPPTLASNLGNPKQAAEEVIFAEEEMVDYTLAFEDGLLSRLNDLPSDLLEALDDALADVDKFLRAVRDVVDLLVAVASIPQAIIDRLIGLLDNAISTARKVSSLFVGADPFTGEKIPGGIVAALLAGRDDAVSVIGNQAQVIIVARKATDAQYACLDFGTSLKSQRESDILAEVRVPAGIDLRDLALLYYGDPDQWWAIASANGLSSSKVPAPPSGPSDDPGFPLKIPKLSSGASSNIKRSAG